MGTSDTATVDDPELDAGSVSTGATGPCYLLFTGTQAMPMGGMADLVGVFQSEEEARAAFRRVRLETATSPSSWAQLAVVHGEHGIKPLCWFGIGVTPAPIHRAISADHHQGGPMEIQTVEHLSEGLADLGPPRRRPAKKVAALFAGTLTAGAVIVGALLHSGASDSVVPTITTTRDVATAPVPTVPFAVDSSLAVAGDSSPDR
jgi:hypothetical protein